MDKIVTEDGSITFYNEAAGENYHTKAGARQEAIEKYVKALEIIPGKVIFDVCFGLGYSTAAALDAGPFTVYCFENDAKILKEILDIDSEFKSFHHIKAFIKGYFEGNNVYEKDGVKLIMVFGDARKTILTVPEQADYVFFAPFSPAKVPELWTAQFFKDIYAKMKPSAKLATYSYAKFVRNNLKEAGFQVFNGPILGRRSPSTIAIKN
jgi:tRNA U34 5-methylaminomethyl-2-thiouridine-forming methyltransferase MnmC